MKVYSSARAASGPLLFISGQVPAAPDGSVSDDPYAQARQALANVAAVLDEHELGWGAVAKLTYYLRRIEDLQAVRRAVTNAVPEPRPAATLVEVSGLVDQRYLVEIDAVADLGSSRR